MKWKEQFIQSRWPIPFPEFTVVPGTTALLIIDMQYYLHPDYGVGKVIKERFPDVAHYFIPRLKEIVVPNIGRLQEFFRRNSMRIVFTTIGPELPDGSDMIRRRRNRDSHAVKDLGAPHLFPKDAKEHEILQELSPRPGELVINKNCSSPFNCGGIDQILRNMGVESLIVTGLSTDACVVTTARDAADRGYNCIIVEDACAAFDPLSHEAELFSYARIFGKVMTSEEVIAQLGGRTVTPA
jgi:nicotinamidase-related amidase